MGSFLGSAAGAVAGGISSIISGALSNSAARHAATVANQRNIYNYQHRYQWAMEESVSNPYFPRISFCIAARLVASLDCKES